MKVNNINSTKQYPASAVSKCNTKYSINNSKKTFPISTNLQPISEKQQPASSGGEYKGNKKLPPSASKWQDSLKKLHIASRKNNKSYFQEHLRQKFPDSNNSPNKDPNPNIHSNSEIFNKTPKESNDDIDNYIISSIFLDYGENKEPSLSHKQKVSKTCKLKNYIYTEYSKVKKCNSTDETIKNIDNFADHVDNLVETLYEIIEEEEEEGKEGKEETLFLEEAINLVKDGGKYCTLIEKYNKDNSQVNNNRLHEEFKKTTEEFINDNYRETELLYLTKNARQGSLKR